MQKQVAIERKPSVLQRTGMSNSTLYEEVAAGRFPRPVKIGARSVGWISTEVDAWIEQRIQQRDQEAA